jgi:hypothetical protein
LDPLVRFNEIGLNLGLGGPIKEIEHSRIELSGKGSLEILRPLAEERGRALPLKENTAEQNGGRPLIPMIDPIIKRIGTVLFHRDLGGTGGSGHVQDFQDYFCWDRCKAGRGQKRIQILVRVPADIKISDESQHKHNDHQYRKDWSNSPDTHNSPHLDL